VSATADALALVAFLESDAARAALAEIEDVAFDPVVHVPRFRTRFNEGQAAVLADVAGARRLASAKFGPVAGQMFFTPDSVQQATPREVAQHRAERLSPVDHVVDLGCSIGGDAMALGVPRRKVIGVEVDPMRLVMARHNVALTGASLVGVRADLEELAPFAGESGFADPGRRTDLGRRIFDVERYRPPLSLLVGRWVPRFTAFAIKVHPGIDCDSVPPECSIEFVSLHGEMREACLWFGRPRAEVAAEATLLPSGVSMGGAPESVLAELSEVGDWMYEPDPAVIRAGLVGDLANDVGLCQIDPSIAYLTGPPVSSPFVRGAYRVEEVLPFNLKSLRAKLRALDVGVVDIKKRGTAVEPTELRKRLKLTGDDRRTIILTRSRGRQVAIICAAG
jgi:hypothetical protein